MEFPCESGKDGRGSGAEFEARDTGPIVLTTDRLKVDVQVLVEGYNRVTQTAPEVGSVFRLMSCICAPPRCEHGLPH